MEYKPIVMILSLFIILILILGTLAATGNAQNSNNTGTQTEEHECVDEFAQLESCIANPENGAATQESSNTGNATEGANNPAPLQETAPAIHTIQPHITTKQLANGLTEEKPAASTNPDCNRTVCVAHAPHTVSRPPPLPTYEDLRPQLEARCSVVKGVKVPCDFRITKIKDKETGSVCPEMSSYFSTVFHGVEYTICAFDKKESAGPEQLHLFNPKHFNPQQSH
jgi:hypothetical protein